MSYALADAGVRLHYDVFGRRNGEPVLLIQGLGADSRGWLLQRPAIGRHYRGIVFDNRGVGRSDKPVGSYDLEQMAADAVAVLDAAGVESAHVIGASMGGVLAQIMAVRYPERVRSLVLACTAVISVGVASCWRTGPRSRRRRGCAPSRPRTCDGSSGRGHCDASGRRSAH